MTEVAQQHRQVAEVRKTLDRLAAAARVAAQGQFRDLLEVSKTALFSYLTSIELEATPPEFTRHYVGDALQRFVHTLQFIPLPAGGRILELGANPYFFHILLRRFFPDSHVEGVNFFDHDIFSDHIGVASHRLRAADFEEDWAFTYPTFNLEVVARYPLPPASFDLIFFCETLEHLVVNPLAVFRKIRRLLAPGGHLVVSLPNAARLSNLACMLDGYNYFDLYHPDTGVHGRHNREFTLAEMKTLLTLNGFEVCRAETRDRFDYDQVPIVAVDYSGDSVALDRRRTELEGILKKAGGRLEDRGDNLYLLAQRPIRPAGVPTAPPDPGVVPCSPPTPSARAVAFVDILEDDSSRLALTGWAFLTDEYGEQADWIKLVLVSPDRCYSVVCSRTNRQDVADQFGLDRDDPGFSVAVEKAGLPPGSYRLGVLLGGPVLAEGFRDLGVRTEVH